MAKGEMLSKMITLATTAHHGQYDKGGRPYILHPLTVMHHSARMMRSCSASQWGMTSLKTPRPLRTILSGWDSAIG